MPPAMRVDSLLVAFGTTVPQARRTFDVFDTIVKQKFPDNEVRWAYTSSMVRKKLATQGILVNSVQQALEQYVSEGFSTIVIQSLHTIPGTEYHTIVYDVSAFKHLRHAKNINIQVGKPLLAHYDDVVKTATALLAHVPEKRLPSDALVFMGHGSRHHSADLIYVALASVLKAQDPYAFLGTVEGHPTINDVVKACKEMKCTKAWLIPFMAIAGDHVINDMAGDEEDSWKSILSKHGISSHVVLNGTLDNPDIRAIWLKHLETVLSDSKENRK